VGRGKLKRGNCGEAGGFSSFTHGGVKIGRGGEVLIEENRVEGLGKKFLARTTKAFIKVREGGPKKGV